MQVTQQHAARAANDKPNGGTETAHRLAHVAQKPGRNRRSRSRLQAMSDTHVRLILLSLLLGYGFFP